MTTARRAVGMIASMIYELSIDQIPVDKGHVLFRGLSALGRHARMLHAYGTPQADGTIDVDYQPTVADAEPDGGGGTVGGVPVPVPEPEGGDVETTIRQMEAMLRRLRRAS